MFHWFRSRRPARPTPRVVLDVQSLLEDRTVPCMGSDTMMEVMTANQAAAVAAQAAAQPAAQPAPAPAAPAASSAARTVLPPVMPSALTAVGPAPVEVTVPPINTGSPVGSALATPAPGTPPAEVAVVVPPTVPEKSDPFEV